MHSIIKGVELVMYENTPLPEQNYNKESKSWVKTGGVVDKTTYTFRDTTGSKLVLLGTNAFRALERKIVDVEVKIEFNDFKKQNRVTLANVTESKSK